MVARVTHYRIRTGKLEEFSALLESLVALIDKRRGFRVLISLRGEEKDSRDVTSISVWETKEDLHASDNDKAYYAAVARLMKCCESFSPMHEQDVLVSKFPAGDAVLKAEKASR